LETVSGAIFVAALLATAGLGALFVRSANADGNPGFAMEAAAVSLYLTLVVLRAPVLFSFYRIWAETLGLYFAEAYENGPVAGLLNTSSNYYDLSANLASVVAVTAGLQWWPVVDTGFGLAAAAALPFVLLGLGFTLEQRIAALIAVSTAVFCVTASETFGTVLHNKGWGAVYVAIVLASIAVDPDTGKFRKVLLLVLPLTGTVAVFALISWGAAAAVLGLRSLVRPLAWALPGIVVQLVCALLPAEHTGLAVRPLSLSTMIYIPDLFVVKAIAATLLPSLFFRSVVPGQVEIAWTIGVSAAIAFASLYAASRRHHHWALLVLVAMGVFYGSAVLAVGGASALLPAGSSFRYYFPVVAILMIALAFSCLRFGPAAKTAFVALCMCIVASNHSYNIMVSQLFFRPQEWDWSSQARTQLSSPAEGLQNYPSGNRHRLPDCGEHYC
jgi:hypothetical protein